MKPKRKVIPNDREFRIFSRMEGNTMNPDPVAHFVNDVFIAFEDMAIPVIRFSGDDKNLMAESNPFLAK